MELEGNILRINGKVSYQEVRKDFESKRLFFDFIEKFKPRSCK